MLHVHTLRSSNIQNYFPHLSTLPWLLFAHSSWALFGSDYVLVSEGCSLTTLFNKIHPHPPTICTLLHPYLFFLQHLPQSKILLLIGVFVWSLSPSPEMRERTMSIFLNFVASLSSQEPGYIINAKYLLVPCHFYTVSSQEVSTELINRILKLMHGWSLLVWGQMSPYKVPFSVFGQLWIFSQPKHLLNTPTEQIYMFSLQCKTVKSLYLAGR